VREAATICPRPLQVDLLPSDLESGVRVTYDVGYPCTNFSLPRPLCSRLRPDVRDRRQTDRRQTRIIAWCPYPRFGDTIITVVMMTCSGTLWRIRKFSNWPSCCRILLPFAVIRRELPPSRTQRHTLALLPTETASSWRYYRVRQKSRVVFAREGRGDMNWSLNFEVWH